MSTGVSTGFGAKFGGGAFSLGKLIALAIVGGVASVLGGGKFENGAVTGAFLMVFETDFVIYLTVTKAAFTTVGGDTVYVDPKFHPTTQSAASPIAAITQRILDHELGHSAMNFADSDPGNMNNVTFNENLVNECTWVAK